MKDRHVLHELSAYLDGETNAPERIQAHLQSCAGCASRYRELKAVSDALRKLPAPDAIPGFEASVALRIRSQATPGSRSLFAPARRYAALVSSLAAAAGIALMFTMFWQAQNPSHSLNVSRLGSASAEDAPGIMDFLWESESSPLDFEYPGLEGSAESDEGIALALGDTPWFQQALEAWQDDQDLDELVSSLGEAEKRELEQLLYTYSREGGGI